MIHKTTQMADYAELIKALRCCSKIDARNNGCDSCPYEYCGDDCQNLCGYAADAIEELLARDVVPMDFHERCLQLEIKKRIELEKQMPQWISVEERLPEPYQTVIFYTNAGPLVGYMHADKTFTFYANRPRDPSHWMPLPEPPKGVE